MKALLQASHEHSWPQHQREQGLTDDRKRFHLPWVAMLVLGSLPLLADSAAAAGKFRASHTGPGKAYYLDCSQPTNGDGSLKKPWNTVESVNNHPPFAPGDTIYVKRGTTCVGELWPKGSGDINHQIVLRSYGPVTDPKPLIDAQGVENSSGVRLHNQEYWTIQDLEITNPSKTVARRWGIRITADDKTVKHRLRILNNTVRDVYATAIRRPKSPAPSFYDVAGIYVKIDEPGRADEVLIQDNVVSNIVAVGITFWGAETQNKRGPQYQDPKVWDGILSSRVVVRGNIISRTGADGMIIFGTDNELVEYNLAEFVSELAVSGTDYTAGIWPTRHRDGLWQYNVVRDTRRTGDGQAFDNDNGGMGTTIFQYNVTINNAGGFFLNHGPAKNILRYNISINETLGRLGGNIEVCNNIFFAPNRGRHIELGNNSKFHNNILCSSKLESVKLAPTSSFSHNVYYGGMVAPTNDVQPILADPQFDDPALWEKVRQLKSAYEIQAAVRGAFTLKPSSPCIGKGILVKDNGGMDFFGNPVSADLPPSCGVHEPQVFKKK